MDHPISSVLNWFSKKKAVDLLFHLMDQLEVFFQAEDGIRDSSTSRGLGDVYKRQIQKQNESILEFVMDHPISSVLN